MGLSYLTQDGVFKQLIYCFYLSSCGPGSVRSAPFWLLPQRSCPISIPQPPHPNPHNLLRVGQWQWLKKDGTAPCPDCLNQVPPRPTSRAFSCLSPNIYPIYDLWECVKGLILRNHEYGNSMTLGSGGIAERSFSEAPVLLGYQKP